TVCVKNVSDAEQMLVQATVTASDKHWQGDENFIRNQREYIVLYRKNREEIGKRRKHMYSVYTNGTHEVDYRLTIGVQSINVSIDSDDHTVLVIVQEKEFRVNAPYLAQWSDYFRAYFNADMKEKKEGRYPVKDQNISADDFEELLMVILPCDRPITARNYKMLLRLASRFEMPQLTRRIERFLLDFERNGLTRSAVFRVATDQYNLPLIQAMSV
ncbi:hypothetical protein PMAYCL1PPCAC_28107, partial [Pristionchus mayeri]